MPKPTRKKTADSRKKHSTPSTTTDGTFPRSRRSRKKAEPSAESSRPLRLEWVEAGSLDANPRNWRRHPVGQMDALRESLGDGEIGWAGALLYNETTGHLIDGHARKEAVDPETLVPVLIGSWTAGAERKILLTLDPITAMAEADGEALRGLLSETAFETAGLQGVLDGLWVELSGEEPSRSENPDGKEYGEDAADDVEMLECPNCGHKFPA